MNQSVMAIVKKILIPLLILLLVGTALWFRIAGSSGQEGQGGGNNDQPLMVNAMVLSGESAQRTFSTSGNIIPDERVNIRAEVAGRIETINFEEGTGVRKGDLLVKIDDAELQAELKRLNARKDFLDKKEERQRNLLEADAISQEAYDDTYFELQSVSAEIENVSARLDKTTIRAPFSGTIGIREVSPGTFVSSESPIATLVRDNPVKLEFAVPERHAPYVRKGDSVLFSVTGMDEKDYARIYARQPFIDEATRSLSVRAIYDNPEGLVIPGAFARVELKIDEYRTAVSIPSQTLIPDIEGHRVYLYNDGNAKEQQVEIAIREERDVIISEGLSEGDTLIVTGLLELRPGRKVEIRELTQAKSEN